MTCAAEPCFTCRAAGLAACPFKQTCGPNLPLVFGELPKVTRRPRIVYLPPGASMEDAERILDRYYGKRE